MSMSQNLFLYYHAIWVLSKFGSQFTDYFFMGLQFMHNSVFTIMNSSEANQFAKIALLTINYYLTFDFQSDCCC